MSMVKTFEKQVVIKTKSTIYNWNKHKFDIPLVMLYHQYTKKNPLIDNTYLRHSFFIYLNEKNIVPVSTIKITLSVVMYYYTYNNIIQVFVVHV